MQACTTEENMQRQCIRMAGLLLLAMVATDSASAQTDYPNNSVRLISDFAPVGFTFDQPLAIAVSPKLGVKTLQELIDLARKKPGELSYAVTGVGRFTHLAGELLQLRTGIKLQMVPYTSSAQALADVYAGRVPVVIDGYTGLVPAFQSGTVV